MGCWGTYGSRPGLLLPEACCMPLSAPLADGPFACAPLEAAGDPWAWACVVCAGGFCDENFELMLDIHELRRELVLESGGVVPPFFASLPRPSIMGRFGGILCGVDVAVVAGAGAGAGGEAGRCTAGAAAGPGAAGSPWLDGGLVGSPPWDDVLGGASLVRPGDDGACVRWWWSIISQVLVRPSCTYQLLLFVPLGPVGWSAQRKRSSPLVELCSHDTSTPWMSSIADVCSCDG